MRVTPPKSAVLVYKHILSPSRLQLVVRYVPMPQVIPNHVLRQNVSLTSLLSLLIAKDIGMTVQRVVVLDLVYKDMS